MQRCALMVATAQVYARQSAHKDSRALCCEVQNGCMHAAAMLPSAICTQPLAIRTRPSVTQSQPLVVHRVCKPSTHVCCLLCAVAQSPSASIAELLQVHAVTRPLNHQQGASCMLLVPQHLF